MSRFVLDAHVHGQRWSPGLLRRGEKFTYAALEKAIMTQTPWDNSRALLYDMDRLGIDMTALACAFNQRCEMIREQVRRRPGRFVGLAAPVETLTRAFARVERFDAERAAAETDYWLSQPEFVGIGELPGLLLDPDPDVSVEANVRNLYPIMEVAAQHRAPVLVHTGFISFPVTGRVEGVTPTTVDAIAGRYPEVPIILGHMGAGGMGDWLPEMARAMAARHEHVYLESSKATAQLIERAYHDPAIGPRKLIFGSDWGASVLCELTHGPDGHRTYELSPSTAPPRDVTLMQDWSLRQIAGLDLPPQHKERILGTTAAKLFGIDVEAHLRTLQQERYGDQIALEDTPPEDGWRAEQPTSTGQ